MHMNNTTMHIKPERGEGEQSTHLFSLFALFSFIFAHTPPHTHTYTTHTQPQLNISTIGSASDTNQIILSLFST